MNGNKSLKYIFLFTNTISIVAIIWLIFETIITGNIPGIDSRKQGHEMLMIIHDWLYYFFPLLGTFFSLAKYLQNRLHKRSVDSLLEKYILYSPFIYWVLFIIFICSFIE